ncbi:unnamed protein product [Pneumocystis jirovecii]|uniref:FHA domain-containing protein n=1 Tax=Pneumocystis jirovecii TaxID=42068 RepID=L0PBB4_PNEJI|nr:unnamed protein product [Pneumocystis jirovecii]
MVSRLGTLFVLRKGTEEEYAQFPITKRLNTFGRHLSCDVRLYDELISRQHARLEIDDNGNAFLENLSINGTFVNNKELNISENKRFQLNTGDIISLAGHKFRWEYPIDKKKADQIVIYTPQSKMHISIKSKKASLLFSKNKDVVVTPSINRENQLNLQISAKNNVSENIVSETKDSFDIIDSKLENGMTSLNETFNSKDSALAILCSPKKYKFNKSFIENEILGPGVGSIIGRDVQIMDNFSKSDSKSKAFVFTDKSPIDVLVSKKPFKPIPQDFGLIMDFISIEKDIIFSNEVNELVKKDLRDSFLKENQLEFQKYKEILSHSTFFSKILPQKKINTSEINDYSCGFRTLKLEENSFFSPPKEKSCSILPNSHPSPLKQGSPILHFTKKYKKRSSFSSFMASNVLNNPTLMNLRLRRSISDSSFVSSTYITKVKSMTKKHDNLPTTPLEFLILNDSEKKLLGSTPLFSLDSGSKENNANLLMPLEYNVSLKNDAIYNTVLCDFDKIKQRYNNDLEDNIKPKTVCPEFKTFSPGKWAVTFNGKKQKLYESPIHSINENALLNNLSVANMNCLNRYPSVSRLKDIDKVFSPGKWALTAPGKKMKLYRSPNIRTKSMDKLACNSFKSKLVKDVSREMGVTLNCNLDKFNFGIDSFQNFHIDYSDKKNFEITDISDSIINENEESNNIFLSLNNEEKDLHSSKNLYIDMSESIENDHKNILKNSPDDIQKLYINNSVSVNKSKVKLLDQNVREINIGIPNDHLLNFAKLSCSTAIDLELFSENTQKLSNKFNFKDNDSFSELFKHHIFKEEQEKMSLNLFQTDMQKFQSNDMKLVAQIRDYDQYIPIGECSVYGYEKYNSSRNMSIPSLKYDNIKNNDSNLSNLLLFDQVENTIFMGSPSNMCLQNQHVHVNRGDKDKYDELNDFEENSVFFNDIMINETNTFSDGVVNEFTNESLFIEKSDENIFRMHNSLESNLVIQVDQCFQPMAISSLFVGVEDSISNKKTSISKAQLQNIENVSIDLAEKATKLNVCKENIEDSTVRKSGKKTQLKPIRASNRIKERSKVNNDDANNNPLKNYKCNTTISQEKVYCSNRRVTRSLKRSNCVNENNDNVIKLAEQAKTSKKKRKKSLIEKSFFIDVSEKLKRSPSKKRIRITRNTAALNGKAVESKNHFDSTNLTNVKNSRNKTQVFQKNGNITAEVATEISLEQNKKQNLKKRNISRTVLDVQEKTSKRRNVSSNNNDVEPSSERVRSLRNRLK